jgi:acetolactate synthase-1/3 small subunit
MNETRTGVRQYTINLYVSNKPGVLIRIALVFSRRGYNIDSLVVSEGHNPAFSHMTITATGEERTLDQIIKQLNKLVDVVHARGNTGKEIIERELALIKVRCRGEKRDELFNLADSYGFDVVDIRGDTVIIQSCGDSAQIDVLHRRLSDFVLLELVRTGKVLIAPGRERSS